MIPKVVHYIWLGGKPKDKLTEICLLTFKDKMPNYEFVEWIESNENLTSSGPVLKQYIQTNVATNNNNNRLLEFYIEMNPIFFDNMLHCIKIKNLL